MSLRIALIDDHALFRDGLRGAIQNAGMTVVGEAASAKEALEKIPQLQPDVVVVDVALPDQDGIAVTRELARRQNRNVLMLTAHNKPHLAQESFDAGAKGFALKSDTTEHIVEAIRVVAGGEVYLGEELRKHIGTNGTAAPNAIASLSQREREVFNLLVQGASNRQIASTLYISLKTVETHRTHIYRKLGTHSAVELFQFALRNQVLPVSESNPERH
jgi:DNA-binding NarL/FixJ family response regulator